MNKIENFKKCPNLPSKQDFYYLECNTLDKDDINKISEKYTNGWYWYRGGKYDGYGYIVLESELGFDVQDLAHCSCSGPLDRTKAPRGEYKTLQAILEEKKQEKEVKNLVNWILTGK